MTLRSRPNATKVVALAAASGIPLTRRAAARLHEHTQGNAQLLATVLAEVPAANLTASAGSIPAPRSFSEWVQQAFADADEDQRAVVAAVALLDRAATVAEVAAVSRRLGVSAWQERAERELAMSGLRSLPGGKGLTPSEREVSRLAVAGLTNREIADDLSVSIKTVESHLTRVFVKLGVRHRVELVQAMAADDRYQGVETT